MTIYSNYEWILSTNSIKPKETTVINKHEKDSQPDTSMVFQPSAKYTLLGSSYESVPDSFGKEINEEGIYEVLDGNEEKSQANVRKPDKNVVITGDYTESYNKLEFKD